MRIVTLIYVKLILKNMQTKLTFLLEDSLANPSALPEKEKAQMMNATCGAKCLEQFKRLNPNLSSQKMFLVSRILMADWYSSRCALTWKMKGTKFSRLLFQLQPKTLRIAETDAGLLPTPTAMMDEAPIEKVDARNQKQMEKGNSPFILGLGQQAMRGMLPTPTASDVEGGISNPNQISQKNGRFVRTSNNTGTEFGAKLRDVVGMLPTPNAAEGYKAAKTYNPKSQMGFSLSAMAGSGMLPTPTAMDSTSATATMKSTQVKEGSMHSMTLSRFLLTPSASDGLRSGMTMDSLKRHNKVNAENSNLAEQIAHKVGGGTSHLNPRFVAEMMGFPHNWTESPFQSGEQNQSKDTAMP